MKTINENTEVIELDSILEGENYDAPLYDKFTEAYRTDEYEVLSDDGWINIEGVGKTIEYDVWEIKTANTSLKCADEHILIQCFNLDFNNKKLDLNERYVKDLSVGNFIMTKGGPEEIISLERLGEKKEMYDLQVDRESKHLYYMNDILSHNSLWMQNFSVKTANQGKNVLYITLEMSVKKCVKRFGSMRLKIPINEYDDVSQDTDYIKRKIQELYDNPSYITGASGDSMFEGSSHRIGKIFTKFYAAGTATVEDFDTLIEKIEIKKGIKIDMVVVDYISLIAPVRGLGIESNLYLKGKHIAEGLRAIGAKYKLPVITGIQVSKDAWNSTDVTLDKVPESKAIAETADTFFAIIRTETMKQNNLYRLKLLKQRDGSFDKSQAVFDLNGTYLSIENDRFFEE